MSAAAGTAAVLAEAEAALARAGVASPAADALSLLAHAWERDEARVRRARLFDEDVPADIGRRFANLCARRGERVPLQHLTGIAHFRLLALPVGPGVFVPRPETELVAQAGLDALAERRARSGAGSGPARVLDLCTGSGALGLALAVEAPGTSAVGVEIDAQAAAWAGRSVAAAGDLLAASGSRFRVVLGDAGDAERVAGICAAELGGSPHVVVSNPPYVLADGSTCEPEVIGHDPRPALWGGGADGLAVPARVIAAAAAVLAPGGVLVLEHADVQGAAVRTLMAGAGLTGAETRSDYTGRDRFTLATRC
ncbi:N5-glutamine methyltransferase family protein [Brevibacterium album]|uniref:N5-glutamine methyltransferase family protein n=1 Tax=Brevibacterium album TaxID=417948 RepID=UPI000423716A|nr:HemK/PrmC family methyltransferase [Brevibacterium album]